MLAVHRLCCSHSAMIRQSAIQQSDRGRERPSARQGLRTRPPSEPPAAPAPKHASRRPAAGGGGPAPAPGALPGAPPAKARRGAAPCRAIAGAAKRPHFAASMAAAAEIFMGESAV